MGDKASFGSATDKQKGGTADPNVLSLKDTTKIRLVEPTVERWRQHGIDGKNFEGADDEDFQSVVCPRGPHGTGGSTCPLCMKPTNAEGKQQFPISRRYAVNVWDYESQSVKVLIAGPQVFEEFDATANVGIDPTACDWMIHKQGTGISTKYKLVRGDSTPLTVEIKPEDLHDTSKYSDPPSVEKIFEALERLGIDYDALELPSYTLEQAEAFVMPYGKHKGMTIEQLYHNDKDYLLYIYNSKREQGMYGEAVFIAMHTILVENKDVDDLDELPKAPPRAATTASTPASGTTTLVGPDGNEIEAPDVAVDALLAQGYSRPAPPEPDEPMTEEDIVIMVGPDGTKVSIQAGSVGALEAAGYKREQPKATEPDPQEPTEVVIGGTINVMPYSAAKAVVDSGGGTWPETGHTQVLPAQQEALPDLPADDDEVEATISALPDGVKIPPMKWSDVRNLIETDQGGPADPKLRELYELHRARATDESAEQMRDEARSGQVDPSPASAATTSPPSSSGDATTADLDPSKTVGPDADGKWTHPALEKTYATKGAVTQALNRLKAQQPTVTQASGSAQAPADGSNGNGDAASDDVRERVRKLLESMPSVAGDFKTILGIFEEVSGGKRSIADFNDDELVRLEARLQQEKDKATA